MGHETDFTIADFVSDLRAATPTAAAELAVPDRIDLQVGLTDLQQRLVIVVKTQIENKSWAAQAAQNDLRRNSPAFRIRSDRQRVDEIMTRLGVALRHGQTLQRAGLNALEQRLKALNPLAVLQRGYAIVSTMDGRNVRLVEQVKSGDALHVRVSDGTFAAEVIERSKKEDQ